LVSEIRSLHSSKLCSILHPATYLNKFLFAYEDGTIELWNIRTCKLLYTFQSHLLKLQEQLKLQQLSTNENHLISHTITCLQQTPSVDVIAIGFQNGYLMILNVKLDCILFCFRQSHSVTNITFRTDAAADQYPYLISTSKTGHIFTWMIGSGNNNNNNNNNNIKQHSKLLNITKYAHGKYPIHTAEFYYSEPILVTAGEDNAIRIWIYDQNTLGDYSPRLLKYRQGHILSPCHMKYYGDTQSDVLLDDQQHAHNGVQQGSVTGMISADAIHQELSSSESSSETSSTTMPSSLLFTRIDKYGLFDRLSMKNIIKTGKLYGKKYLPKVIDYDYVYITAKTWGNMVTIHEHCSYAFVWKMEHKAATEIVLELPSEYLRYYTKLQQSLSQSLSQSQQAQSQSVIVENQSQSDSYSQQQRLSCSSVCCSPCGNFAFIGYSNGWIGKFNIQSGLFRGFFPKDPFPENDPIAKELILTPINAIDMDRRSSSAKVAKSGSVSSSSAAGSATTGTTITSGHTKQVTGLYVNTLYTQLISCSADGYLIYWRLSDHIMLKKVLVNPNIPPSLSPSALPSPYPLTLLRGHKESNLLAVSEQDNLQYTIRVYDTMIQQLARIFIGGHSAEILDMLFTGDGRRLLSSSRDHTIRIWHLPTGRCLSWLRFDAPVNSIALTAGGDLYVARDGQRGVMVCLDRSFRDEIAMTNDWKTPVDMMKYHWYQQEQKAKQQAKRQVKQRVDQTAYQQVVSFDTIEGETDISVMANDDEDEDMDEDMDEDTNINIHAKKDDEDEEDDNQMDSSYQVPKYDRHLLEMSEKPKAYWTSIFQAEALKKRKNIVQPMKKQSTPFFLASLEPVLKTQNLKEEKKRLSKL
jgi:WD40 repeat protein